MINKYLSPLVIAALLITSFSRAGERSDKEPPQKYKKWIEEEVVYIISSVEKDVFLQLDSDRERELFIEAFWKHRDPTQGTPDNEFKTEHYRRIEHANHFFGRSVPKSGWKTDRGRMYIILGEPIDTERFLGEAQLFNTEIWFYQGMGKHGLPTGFHLVFFQKGGSGEYVLYNPTSDGPQALLANYFGDQTNYLQAYRTLKKVSPRLATVSLSLIPGESPQAGRPSLASNILLQNIYGLPQKQLDDKYANKFLLYKDIVEVDYSANYIDNDSLVRVIKDESGFSFVHYGIQIKRFSVESYKDKYVTNLKINVIVADLEGKTVYQQEQSIPFDLDDAQIKKLTYNPFILYDMFPLVPGDYKLSVLLKNEVSKEFTSLEEHIHIPEGDSSPRISPMVLGYNMEKKDRSALRPFQIGVSQMFFQPGQTFLRRDKLFLCFQVYGLNEILRKNSVLRYEIFRENELELSSMKKLSEYTNPLSIEEEFSLQDLQPGYYEIVVTLNNGDSDVVTSRERFEITPLSRLPRPWIYSKILFPVHHPAHSFIIGTQHFNLGNIEQSRSLLEKAHKSQPDSLEYSLSLARVYLALNEFSKAKEILMPFLESPEPNYHILFLMGKVHQSLGEFSQAVFIYDRAISHFGINTSLLNSLGDCYQALGRIQEAFSAWSKSLEINADQPQIKTKLESIKK